MERNTRTPVIDGGVVNAPGNTTARHDFAENPQHGQSGTGTTASGPGYGRTATAEQPYTGQGNNTGLDYGRTTTAEQPYTGQGNNTGLDYGRTTTAEQPYTGQGNNTGVDYGRTTTAEQPYTGQGNNTGLAADTRPTGSKIRESASGVKGLAAAVHGTGEMLRGHINATVDRAVNDVCFYFIYPHKCHHSANLGSRCGRVYRKNTNASDAEYHFQVKVFISY
jgi:hypothetical protein